jgi:hypothetical protein
MAAVPPGRAAFGNKLFAAEGHAAVATVAGLDSNSRFVDEHYSVSSVLGRGVHCGNERLQHGARTAFIDNGGDAMIS